MVIYRDWTCDDATAGAVLFCGFGSFYLFDRDMYLSPEVLDYIKRVMIDRRKTR